MDERLFRVQGIREAWFDYDGYPEYPQLGGGFSHGVPLYDPTCYCGRSAPAYTSDVE